MNKLAHSASPTFLWVVMVIVPLKYFGLALVVTHALKKRHRHGMGVITVNGEDRLAVVGGLSDNYTELDSIELYNTETEEWETTKIKLQTPSYNFGCLSLNLRDIISKL